MEFQPIAQHRGPDGEGLAGLGELRPVVALHEERGPLGIGDPAVLQRPEHLRLACRDPEVGLEVARPVLGSHLRHEDIVDRAVHGDRDPVLLLELVGEILEVDRMLARVHRHGSLLLRLRDDRLPLRGGVGLGGRSRLARGRRGGGRDDAQKEHCHRDDEAHARPLEARHLDISPFSGRDDAAAPSRCGRTPMHPATSRRERPDVGTLEERDLRPA